MRKLDNTDENDKAVAIRETSEEIGLDLTSPHALFIGNLPVCIYFSSFDVASTHVSPVQICSDSFLIRVSRYVVQVAFLLGFSPGCGIQVLQ
jgi:8-oxo-dGTP pyrophosphatase MutT (NUDIX family)